jgi:ABC-type Na+ efflux pump permease subunit
MSDDFDYEYSGGGLYNDWLSVANNLKSFAGVLYILIIITLIFILGAGIASLAGAGEMAGKVSSGGFMALLILLAVQAGMEWMNRGKSSSGDMLSPYM